MFLKLFGVLKRCGFLLLGICNNDTVSIVNNLIKYIHGTQSNNVLEKKTTKHTRKHRENDDVKLLKNIRM